MPGKIENVSDLINDIKGRFPDDHEFIIGWSDGYFHELGKLPPAELRQVASDTLTPWRFKRPPKPADFAAHVRRPAVMVPVAEQERLRAALLCRVGKGQITLGDAQGIWAECHLTGAVDPDRETRRRHSEAA